MRFVGAGQAFAFSLIVAAVSPAAAQEKPMSAPASRPAGVTAPEPPGKTGKERLGEKWTDEQRVDNCKVPIDKRGPKPRPDACARPPSR